MDAGRRAGSMAGAIAGAMVALWLCMALPAAALPAGAWPRLQEIDIGQGSPAPPVRAIVHDPQGYLWFATDDGLLRHDGHAIERWQRGGRHRLPGNEVQALRLEADGRLWLQFGDAAPGWLSRDRRHFAPLPAQRPVPAGPRQQPRVRDGEGALWVGGPGGLRLRTSAGAWRDWSAHPQLGGPVQALALDEAGGLWIGGEFGLRRLPPGWRGLGELPLPADADGRCAETAQAVAAAGDAAAWVAAGPCLYLLSVDDGGARWQRQRLLAADADGVLRALSADARGGVWFLRDGAFWHWSKEGTAAAWPLPLATPGLQAKAVQADEAGGAWLLDADGRLWRADPAAAALMPVQVPASPWVHLFRGADGRPWALAGDGALWRLSHAGPRPLASRAPPGSLALLAAADQLWSYDGERVRVAAWDGTRLGRWRVAVADAGYMGLARAGLLADGQGRAWLLSRRGVQLLGHAGVPPAPAQVFPVPLPGTPAPGQSAWLSGPGLGLFPGSAGLVLVVPARWAAMPRPAPRIRLELAFGHERPPVLLPAAPAWLRLGADERELRLRLRRLAFDEPGGQRYRVSLEGLDEAPVELGPSGERVFPALAPGRYRLQVATVDAGGQWRLAPPLGLEVAPPWWRSREGLALLAMGALGLVGASASVLRRRQWRREAWRVMQRRRREAERHSEAKSRFLAMLGHEIRTPMTGVLGMAELMQSEPLTPRQRERLDALQSAGRHLLRLVNDSLDLARIEAGRLALQRQPVEVPALAEEVAGLLAPLARAKGLAFELHVQADAPDWLLGDATRVRQILLNLGHNAVKFCDRGRVRLCLAAAPGGGLRVEVSDSGPGLAPAQRARLFRRFEPGGASSGGSGLGLAISQELAMAMDGRIQVRSEPGAGACFEVLLPLPPAPAPALPALSAPPGGAGQPRRVLLVEDDAMVASVVRELLENAGHAVSHAPHGLAALAALESDRYHLMLLDLDLPGLDGLALSRLLRDRGDDTPRVALTARADAASATHDAGMIAFLRKPITAAQLLEAVGQWSKVP